MNLIRALNSSTCWKNYFVKKFRPNKNTTFGAQNNCKVVTGLDGEKKNKKHHIVAQQFWRSVKKQKVSLDRYHK